MKLLKKTELKYIGGFLVDPDSEIVNLPGLANELNEILELERMNEFVLKNQAAIEASDKSTAVVYKPEGFKQPKLMTGLIASTPLLDEERAAAHAKALEFLQVQSIQDIEAHLAQYPALAAWFEMDHIVHVPSSRIPTTFDGNPFDWKAAGVVKVIETYDDPDIAKLRSRVRIDLTN